MIYYAIFDIDILQVGDIGKENERFVLQRGVNFGEGTPSFLTKDVVDIDVGSWHSISVGNPKAVIKGADTTGVEQQFILSLLLFLVFNGWL